jgi:hypothetical protein
MEHMHTGLADAALASFAHGGGAPGGIVRPFTVAVDIDGVLYRFVEALRRWRHRTYGIALADMPDPGVYNIEAAWGMDSGALIADMISGVKDGDIFWQGEPYEEGMRGLRALRRLPGVRIVLCTARALPGIEDMCREATETWLAAVGLVLGIDYDELVVVVSDKTGHEWDLLIDDYEKNVRAGHQVGRHGVLVDRGWNAQVPMRQAHWDDIPALVDAAQAGLCAWECCAA